MNKKEFKEQLIFEKYKNQIMYSSDWFRSQIKDEDVNVENLYRKIVNYQIDKFGIQLYKKGMKMGLDYENTKGDFDKPMKINEHIKW